MYILAEETAARKTKTDSCSLHQRSSSTNGQEVMHFLHSFDWDRRNADLRFVLTPWQYDKYVALNHFYRPVAWKAGGWTFAVYSHYGRDRFYNAHPTVFVTYKGGRFAQLYASQEDTWESQ